MRAARRVLAALLVTGLLTGCAQLPRPVTDPEPARPALTAEQATALRARTQDVLAEAVKKKDPKTVGSVLAGPSLIVEQGMHRMARRFGTELTDESWAAGTVQAVQATGDDAYPRTAFVVTKLDRPSDGEGTLVEVFERGRAAGSWKRTNLVSTAAALPTVATTPAGVAVPAAEQVNEYDTRSARTLITVLQSPGSPLGRRFADEKEWSSFLRGSRPSRRDGVIIDYAYADRGSRALATEDGGALVLASVAVFETARAEGDGAVSYNKDAPQRRVYPGQYTAASNNYLVSVLVDVPPAGLIRVIGLQHVWLDSNASTA